MFLKRRILLAACLVLPFVAAAQADDALEQWIGEGGSEADAAEWSDLLLQLRDRPVNVNDTVSLSSLPFFSPFQMKALRNYMTLHGQLLTVWELRYVPGFDSATVAWLEPLLEAKPYVEYERLEWWRGRHTVVTGLGGTVEQAEGYRNGHYEGDNLKALLCYTYNYRNRIGFRFSADKDPAEPWGRVNYYGWHLQLRDFGRMKTLVVGRFNVQFGQGLTLWTGWKPFTLTGGSPVRYAGGVRPAGVFNEEDWQRGAAATFRVGRGVDLSAFASRADGEWMGGGHATWRRGDLIVGLTAVSSRLDDSLQVRDRAYNGNAFRGDRLWNLGADALYRRGALLLFGEAAVGHNGRPAALAGLRLEGGEGNSLGVTGRYYDPLYHNLHAKGYAVGSDAGERGVTLDARLRLPLRLAALLTVNLHRFPALRHDNYSPSTGAWLRAQLGRRLGRHTEAEVRYAWRRKERNVPGVDSTLYLDEGTLRHQWQAQVRYSRGPWRLTTRVVAARFAADRSGRQRGWLVAQEVRHGAGRWQVASQVALFDIGGYYARLYLSEANLQYGFSIPMLNGRGARATAVVRCAVSDALDIGAKYALAAYPGQASVGTGDAATEGPLRQAWHVQLRWKF